MKLHTIHVAQHIGPLARLPGGSMARWPGFLIVKQHTVHVAQHIRLVLRPFFSLPKLCGPVAQWPGCLMARLPDGPAHWPDGPVARLLNHETTHIVLSCHTSSQY